MSLTILRFVVLLAALCLEALARVVRAGANALRPFGSYNPEDDSQLRALAEDIRREELLALVADHDGDLAQKAEALGFCQQRVHEIRAIEDAERCRKARGDE